jgi:hypothetical protein
LTVSFQKQVQDVYDQGHQNALFIFEGCHKFDERHTRALAEFLNPRFRVLVLVAYRRLYEWLPSKYNSVMKPGRNPKIKHFWPPGSDDNIQEESVELHPFHLHFNDENSSNGNNNKERHNDYDDDFDRLVQDIVSTRKHPTQVVRDNYAQYFSNVQVISLHHLSSSSSGDTTASNNNSNTSTSSTTTATTNSSPYLQHLFCHVLRKSTPHICQALEQGDKFQLSNNINPSVPFHFDAIAVEARRLGWIPKSVSRQDARREIQKYYNNQRRRGQQQQRRGEGHANVTQEETYHDCLSPTLLHQLLNLSLTTEHNLFAQQQSSSSSSTATPDHHHQQQLMNDDDDEHRRAFESYRQGKKYCWLNATKFLQHNEEPWKMFLQSLGQQQQQEQS